MTLTQRLGRWPERRHRAELPALRMRRRWSASMCLAASAALILTTSCKKAGTAEEAQLHPPIVIQGMCAFRSSAPLTTETSQEPSTAADQTVGECVPFERPLMFDSAPLPILFEGELSQEGLDELVVMGCLSPGVDVVERFGLVAPQPSSSSIGTPDMGSLCPKLPATSDRPGGGQLAAGAWAQANWGETIDNALDQCRAELAGSSRPLHFVGPEAISNPLVVEIGIGIAIGFGSYVVDNFIDTLSPKDQIAAGTMLLGVSAAMAVGAVATAEGPPLPMLFGGLAIATGTIGLIAIHKGASAPPAPGDPDFVGPVQPPEDPENPENDPDFVGPPAPPKSGRPDPSAEVTSDTCMEDVARLVGCSVNHGRDCEDPELAQMLETIRNLQCQTELVLVGPDDTGYCADDEPTEEERAASIAMLCVRYWSNRTPDPNEPTTCPLVVQELGGPLEDPLRKRMCESVLDASLCPGLGPEAPSPNEPPPCPIEAVGCGPIPPGPETPTPPGGS